MADCIGTAALHAISSTFAAQQGAQLGTLAHMMLAAMTALLSFPLVISHRLRRSLMTVTRNLFS